MHKIFYLNFLNINICGGRQGGSGPPTPGVQPPYRCPIFSSYPHPIFSLFFRVPPPQIHILLPPPPAHLTPAHFSPKAPTPAPLIPGPHPPIPHTHTSVSVSISITGNQLALGFVLLCVLCNIIMISSTCAMTIWFVPNNHGQGCPWRNSQCHAIHMCHDYNLFPTTMGRVAHDAIHSATEGCLQTVWSATGHIQGGIETVSVGGRSARPARSGVHPIWWRWHGNTKSHAILPFGDV